MQNWEMARVHIRLEQYLLDHTFNAQAKEEYCENESRIRSINTTSNVNGQRNGMEWTLFYSLFLCSPKVTLKNIKYGLKWKSRHLSKLRGEWVELDLTMNVDVEVIHHQVGVVCVHLWLEGATPSCRKIFETAYLPPLCWSTFMRYY